MTEQSDPKAAKRTPEVPHVEAASDEPADPTARPGPKVGELSISDLNTIIAAQVTVVVRDELARLAKAGSFAGSHVNSGPPGHANEPGHANFDPKSRLPSNVGGVHVNSGPPGHANEPGHANFDPKARLPGSFAGSHVNSGPPGHANEPGHANFDPKSILSFPAVVLTLPDGGKVSLPAGGPLSITIRGFRIQR